MPTLAALYTQIASQRKRASSFAPPSFFLRLLPCGVLVLFGIMLLRPLCIGRRLYWGDVLLYFEEMLGFASASLRQGQLPLWNPLTLCGQPYIGNPQSAVFYPTTLFLPFLSVGQFISLNSVLHICLCGIFTYLFLRRWTVRYVPAVAGALVYMGSACLISRLQFLPMTLSAPYFPLVLFWIDCCIDQPRGSALLGLAITIGLTLFAGHAQVAYLIFLCGLLYAVARLLSRRRQMLRSVPVRDTVASEEQKRVLRRSAQYLLLAGILGLTLASIHLLPALQLLRESPREQMTAAQANRFYLEPVQLLTLIAPHFLGHPATGDYWGEGTAWEPALFVGWLPLLFIGYAVARCGGELLTRFWAVVGLIGLWLALGKAGGLFWLAFLAVPGVANFHDPARFLFLMTFAFAVLTAVGMDALQARRARWSRRIVSLSALLFIALPLWWYGQDWNPTVPPSLLQPVSRTAAILASEQSAPESRNGRTYLPGHDLYWKRYVTEGYRDYGVADARMIGALQDTLLPNLGMQFGLPSASGYEPVPIQATAALDGLARIALRRGEPNFSRLMSLMGAGLLILPSPTGVYDARLLSGSALNSDLPDENHSSITVWKNRDALPAAWLTPTVRHIEGPMRIAAALTAPDFRPAQVAIVTGTPDADLRELEEGAAPGSRLLPSSVTLVSRTNGEINLNTDAGTTPAYLVYAGTAYPGWKVQVDGRPRSLYRTDGALLGCVLPSGKHHIRLFYVPDSFRIGAYISLVTCGLLAGGGAFLAVQAGVRVRSSGRLRITQGNSA